MSNTRKHEHYLPDLSCWTRSLPLIRLMCAETLHRLVPERRRLLLLLHSGEEEVEKTEEEEEEETGRSCGGAVHGRRRTLRIVTRLLLARGGQPRVSRRGRIWRRSARGGWLPSRLWSSGAACTARATGTWPSATWPRRSGADWLSARSYTSTDRIWCK